MQSQSRNPVKRPDTSDLFAAIGAFANGSINEKSLLSVARRVGTDEIRYVLSVNQSNDSFDETPQGRRFRQAIEVLGDHVRPARTNAGFPRRLAIA